MIILSSRFFQIIGMGMFRLKWHPWRVFIIMGYQFLSIISNGFVATQSLYDRDANVFSTCIVILSATALVLVKILILLILRKEFNRCFRWIEMCFGEKYSDREVDRIWSSCYNRCKKDTLFYTRWLRRKMLKDLFVQLKFHSDFQNSLQTLFCMHNRNVRFQFIVQSQRSAT